MSKYFKAGKKVFEFLKPKPKVNKTELDKAKSKLAIVKQKTKASKAKLNQTLFEIKNKQDLTFKTNKEKTLSNTERKKKADARIKEKKQETKTKHFYAPKNFNKGGRVGLKKGGGKFPDHSGDGKITQKDILMAKGVIPKTKSKKKII
jgi:hypothetical protein